MNETSSTRPAAIVVAGDANHSEVLDRVKTVSSQNASPVMVYAEEQGPLSLQLLSVDALKSLPPETPVVVCDTSRYGLPSGFMETMASKAVEGTLSALSGFKVVDGECRPGKVVKIETHDKRPGMPRYRDNDTGDFAIDILTSVYCCSTASDMAMVMESDNDALSSPLALTMAAKAAGLILKCVDVPRSWARPVLIQTWNTVSHRLADDEVMPILYQPMSWASELRIHSGPQLRNEPPNGSKVNANIPILPVCFMTRNRTAVACHCLDALCKRLKYDGRIYFCICDDRSVKGHVKALERVLEMNGIDEYSVLRTSRGSWGLGASMNNGLAVSFALSDVVLTTEDDFLLCTDLDMTGMVNTIVSNSVAGIRLAHVPGASWNYAVTRTRPCGIHGYIRVVGGDSPYINKRHVFNNQVMLRHRRVYDSIGMYLNNTDTDTVEENMARRYNEKYDSGNSDDMQVLYPSYLRMDTLNSGLFGHIGKSQAGHPPCFSISGYESLNTDRSDVEARSLKDVRPSKYASENIFVINDLQYPGRLGNLMMLVAMTHIYASRRGIPVANVFFKRSVNTRDGWVNEQGEKGRVLTDYLSKNRDVFVPIWGSMLDDDTFNMVSRTPGVVVFNNNVINNTIIREFAKYIRKDNTGIMSSLFYDENTFMRHINDFPEYYSQESVALHVRLTDFKFLKTASRNPKVDADRLIGQCAGKTVVVFSDDIDWCKGNLDPPVGGRIIFHDKPGAPCDDLILMSCFRTVLQTEEISTYSLIAKLLSEDLQKNERMYWI